MICFHGIGCFPAFICFFTDSFDICSYSKLFTFRPVCILFVKFFTCFISIDCAIVFSWTHRPHPLIPAILAKIIRDDAMIYLSSNNINLHTAPIVSICGTAKIGRLSVAEAIYFLSTQIFMFAKHSFCTNLF